VTDPRTPEARGRVAIDAQLERSGSEVHYYKHFDPYAAVAIAVRAFPLATGHGTVDYLLWMHGKAAGTLQARRRRSFLWRQIARCPSAGAR